MRCPNCQMEVEPGRPSCGYCGTPVYVQQPYAPYQQPPPAYYPPPAYMAPAPAMGYYPVPVRQPSSTPVAGGVLVLIGGLLALIYGVFIAGVGAGVAYIPGMSEAFIICAAIMLIFAILAVVGGICAVQRKVWGLALTGAIFCMLSVGPVFISSILGLIGLILIAISKDDFV